MSCIMPKQAKDLREFIAQLEAEGDLLRIKHPVSTHLEMTEIHRRILHKGGPAILFENVIINHPPSASPTTSPQLPATPVLTNLFGTVRRVALGMGRTPEELREVGKTLAYLRQPEPPASLREAWKKLPLLKQVLAMKPKIVRNAPCQDVVLTGDQINLYDWPIQTCWPNDAAPLITWPLVVTQDAKTNLYNLGIYRMQLINKHQTLMRWLKHRGGAQHHAAWKESNAGLASPASPERAQAPIHLRASKPEGEQPKNSMPAAVVIGADPATILAAVTPIPDTVSEYDFSGLLRGSKLELVECKTIPLKVPANAEIVLEGYVSLDDYRMEGPFGDHTGFYNSQELFPVFTITAITHRKKPIYLSTYTGHPPDEPSILGEALNEVFIPLIQQQFPEIVDFWLPPEGCSYRIAVVSINKKYPGHARRIMMGVWSYLRQFIYTKFVIVVDAEINCRDWKQVMWAISTQMDPARDIMVVENTPIDYLDFASVESGLGGKLGMDATKKLPPETHREWGEEIHMSPEIINKVDALMQEMGL